MTPLRQRLTAAVANPFRRSATPLQQHPLVKKLGSGALHPHIWRAHRRSIPKATFIGLWLACCPLPVQMVLAIWWCVRVQAHLPTALALVWVNNPLTIGPMFYVCYRMGQWVLQQQPQSLEFVASWSWFASQLQGAVPALLVGSVVVGTLLGAIGFVTMSGWYRWRTTRKWRQRREITRVPTF